MGSGERVCWRWGGCVGGGEGGVGSGGGWGWGGVVGSGERVCWKWEGMWEVGRVVWGVEGGGGGEGLWEVERGCVGSGRVCGRWGGCDGVHLGNESETCQVNLWTVSCLVEFETASLWIKTMGHLSLGILPSLLPPSLQDMLQEAGMGQVPSERDIAGSGEVWRGQVPKKCSEGMPDRRKEGGHCPFVAKYVLLSTDLHSGV